jgi:hypothetical protein
MKKFLIISFIVLTFGMAGCGGSSGSSGNDANFENTGGSWDTAKNSVTVGGTDENVMVTTATTITFRASDGNSIVLYYANGYPTKAIVGNETDGYSVIVFGNWDATNNTVDVGFVQADGTISFERDVAVDPTIMARLVSVNASISAAQSMGNAKLFEFLDDLTVGEVWEFAGTAFSAAMCGAAIGTAAATAGVATPGVVLACASTAIYLATELDLIGEDNAAANASGTILTGLDLLDCAGGDPTACAGAAFDIGNVIIGYAEDGTADIDDEAQLAQGAVSSGFGDVKVTLTWDSTADLDLYVRDPDGTTISYQNTTSPSGGQLDVDDRDGKHLLG